MKQPETVSGKVLSSVKRLPQAIILNNYCGHYLLERNPDNTSNYGTMRHSQEYSEHYTVLNGLHQMKTEIDQLFERHGDTNGIYSQNSEDRKRSGTVTGNQLFKTINRDRQFYS